MNEILQKRLKELMSEHDLSQREFEKRCGLSNGSITKWKSSIPNQRSLQKVSDTFNVTIDWLVSDDEDTHRNQLSLLDFDEELFDDYMTKSVPVRVVGSDDVIYIERTGYFRAAYKIQDDEMSPRILKDDVVIISDELSYTNGDIVMIKYHDQILCRKLVRHSDGCSYVGNTDVLYIRNDNDSVQILGKVLELRRKF